MKIFKFVGLLFVMVLLISCDDKYQIVIKNQSIFDCKIKSESLKEEYLIESGKEKAIDIQNAVYPFRICISYNNIDEWYRFHDVDHWFSINHKIVIIIKDKEIEIENSGSTRLYKE